jgi:hypothetical protein
MCASIVVEASAGLIYIFDEDPDLFNVEGSKPTRETVIVTE